MGVRRVGKLLTVSVAAYHVEEYLAECLDSFADPDLADSLEVLVINDGAGEGISAIARRYESDYPDIFRLIDKENGGHGSTVNRGIREAAGTYFKTVDGDDKVYPDGLRMLVEYLRTAEDDLVVTDFEHFDDVTGRTMQEMKIDFAGKEYLRQYSFDEISGKVYVNMHAATFRTDILRHMGRQLDEHCFYVDAEYMLYPVPLVETVVFLETPVYRYRLGREEQSMDIHNMQRNQSHHEKVLAHLLDFYAGKMQELSDAKRDYLAKGVAKIAVSQIKIYLSYPPKRQWKEKIREMEECLKNDYPAVYHSVANRAVRVLRHSGYHLYFFVSMICRKAYRV